MTRTVEDLEQFWEHHIGTHEYRKKWMRSHDGVNQPSRKWVLEQVRPGESLLDVGCGPGVTYESFFKAGRADVTAHYTGLDVSPGMVEACRDLFPEGDFRQGSADELPFDDGRFDVVLLRHVLEHALGYEREIAEAVRVARKRVIIVMWRPLTQGPDKMRVREGDPEEYRKDGSNDFNADRFWDYLWSFGYPVNYFEFPEGRKANWAWIIDVGKAPLRARRLMFAGPVLETCVFDLDDWWDGNTCLDELLFIKSAFPSLKVNLFASPGRCSDVLIEETAAHGWLSLCVHGWMHSSNRESEGWTREMADWVLRQVEKDGRFSRVFRAPGWQLGEPTRDALVDRGWVICDHRRNRGTYDYDRVYWSHDPRQVHGHVQDIEHKGPQYRNGVRQLMTERGLPWDARTEFLFIEDLF